MGWGAGWNGALDPIFRSLARGLCESTLDSGFRGSEGPGGGEGGDALSPLSSS